MAGFVKEMGKKMLVVSKKWRSMKNNYLIKFTWDNEADVWIATSDDVPGLVLEHGSFDALVERVRIAVPELLAIDSELQDDIALEYATYRHERLAIHG